MNIHLYTSYFVNRRGTIGFDPSPFGDRVDFVDGHHMLRKVMFGWFGCFIFNERRSKNAKKNDETPTRPTRPTHPTHLFDLRQLQCQRGSQ